MSPELVSDPDRVTAGWLTEVLRHAGDLEAPAAVTGFQGTVIGTGQIGCNVRYRLTYDPPRAGPASIVAKFASRDPVSQAAGIQTRTYETEVAFYRDVAGTVDVARPRCLFADLRTGTAEVVLVLEDLAPAEQGDQVRGCSVEQAQLAMDEAARLHGPRWGDPTLAELAWLAGGSTSSAGIGGLLGMLWPGFVDRYGDALTAEAREVGERFVPVADGWASHVPPARTVAHGDYRLDNMLFATPEGGRPLTVVDWQTVRLGAGASDVSYFLGAGLVPEDRRAHERDLVRRWHDTLLDYDVTGYPFESAWEDYRRYAYSGFVMAVVASMLVGRTERGDAMFMAMANRHATQVRDLRADELLP